jgi:hypothetical protein
MSTLTCLNSHAYIPKVASYTVLPTSNYINALLKVCTKVLVQAALILVLLLLNKRFKLSEELFN